MCHSKRRCCFFFFTARRHRSYYELELFSVASVRYHQMTFCMVGVQRIKMNYWQLHLRLLLLLFSLLLLYELRAQYHEKVEMENLPKVTGGGKR